MAALSKDPAGALMAAFIDQVAADFSGRALRIDDRNVLIAVGTSAFLCRVHLYTEPGMNDPDCCPFIIRVTVGTRQWVDEKHLRQLGFSHESRGDRSELELSMLPTELAAYAPWLVDWTLWRYEETDSVPDPPHELSGDFLLNDERRDCYIWTGAARDAMTTWEQGQDARRADETQFVRHIFPDRYPAVLLRIKAPAYERPEFPSEWVSDSSVRVANGFRPGRGVGRYLTGSAVEARITEACERGYIVLPEDWQKSDRWRAWRMTWWETCQIPKSRRPFITIVISRDESVFGRKLTLSWDWITMDPQDDYDADPTKDPRIYPPRCPAFAAGWRALFGRISKYLEGLPAPGYCALCTEPIKDTIGSGFGQGQRALWVTLAR